MFDEADLDRLCAKIKVAADELCVRLSATTILHEEPATERLIERLENAINGETLACRQMLGYPGTSQASVSLQANGFFPPSTSSPTLTGRSTTSTGRRSEEVRSGADLVIVFESGVPSVEAHKGLLVQAKRHDPKTSQMRSRELKALEQQCKRMLRITKHAFVFLYADHVICLSASAVLEGGQNAFSGTHTVGIDEFFKHFMSCRTGDRRIRAVDQREFEQVLARRETDLGLLIRADEV